MHSREEYAGASVGVAGVVRHYWEVLSHELSRWCGDLACIVGAVRRYRMCAAAPDHGINIPTAYPLLSVPCMADSATHGDRCSDITPTIMLQINY